MPRLLDKHPTGGAFSLSAADQPVNKADALIEERQARHGKMIRSGGIAPVLLRIRPLRDAHIRTHMSRIETADCGGS